MRGELLPAGIPLRKVLVLSALLLEGWAIIVAGFVSPIGAQRPYSSSEAWAVEVGEQPVTSLQSTLLFTRVQTVTLQPSSLRDMYATSYTTTFQFIMTDFPLDPQYHVVLPPDAVVYTATCSQNPICEITWEPNKIIFSGQGKATIYLHYDTSSKATRSPDSRLIQLIYAVGPITGEQRFRLDNTIRFSRTVQLEPQLELGPLVAPPGYVYDDQAHTLSWWLPDTPRVEFTATFTEPMLGSDLVIDRLEMSPPRPAVDQTVYYTVVIRNQGAFGTGHAVLTELYVRPVISGTPDNPHDNHGGWFDFATDALFKWLVPPVEYRVYLPIVMRGASSGSAARLEATADSSYWLAGLGPGEVATGTTSLPWPTYCATESCGVWAKADPAYIFDPAVWSWWGYIPEGLDCGVESNNMPTCSEELNNIAAICYVYLPLIVRGAP